MNDTYDIVNYCENVLGIELLEWQKEFLRRVSQEDPIYILPARRCGYSLMRLLSNLFEEDD